MSVFKYRVEQAISTKSQVELAIGYLRYEAIRKLAPRQFAELWQKCMSSDKSFDSLVDELI